MNQTGNNTQRGKRNQLQSYKEQAYNYKQKDGKRKKQQHQVSLHKYRGCFFFPQFNAIQRNSAQVSGFLAEFSAIQRNPVQFSEIQCFFSAIQRNSMQFSAIQSGVLQLSAIQGKGLL